MNNLSVAPVLVFAATVFLVFKNPTIRIPFTTRHVRIEYWSAPLLGVFFLFLIGSIDAGVISRGVIGWGNVRPCSIIILIMSLVYICVSLDYTGFFEYVALRSVRASKNSGRRLFLYLFVLTSFLTLFIYNDIVILTMALIIFYVCKNARIDPIPFLFVQFFAVNIFGMSLYISNPTNIVAADAHGLSFLEFAKWMFLPSICAGATCLFLSWLVFHRRIPGKFKTPEIDPRLSLKDKNGAIFGSIALGGVVLFMSLPTSWIGLPLWGIALFFAMVVLLYDIVKYRSGIVKLSSRMPWKMVPFLLGFFILVESLVFTGWADQFAVQLSKISGSLIATVLGMSFLCSLAACVMNNHPMTIFFVRVFQSPSFTASQTARLGSTTALIAGSNFGANLTLIGALAGIMWADILSDKGIHISFSDFSKYGFLIMPFVIAVAGLTLTLKLMMWA